MVSPAVGLDPLMPTVQTPLGASSLQALLETSQNTLPSFLAVQLDICCQSYEDVCPHTRCWQQRHLVTRGHTPAVTTSFHLCPVPSVSDTPDAWPSMSCSPQLQLLTLQIHVHTEERAPSPWESLKWSFKGTQDRLC